jgi:putative transcriptional regulator
MADSKKIVGRLKGFSDTIKRGGKVAETYTLRTVQLNLQPTTYAPKKVVETRKLLGASQLVFAQFLGVNVKTVRAWEQGVNTPSDMACRFMDEIRANPEHWQERLRECVSFKKGKEQMEDSNA